MRPLPNRRKIYAISLFPAKNTPGAHIAESCSIAALRGRSGFYYKLF